MTCAIRGVLPSPSSRPGFLRCATARFPLAMAALATALSAAAVPAPAPAGLPPEAAAEGNPPAAAAPDAGGTGVDGSSASTPLLRDAEAFLSGRAAGMDTAALLRAVQEATAWGEVPDRLIEAQGVLLCGKGDWQSGLACLRRLADPGPEARALLGEGALRKGDRYEAAAGFLAAARACPPGDARAPGYYRRYLGIKPADAAVENELADRLEALGNAGEAAFLRAKDPGRAAADPGDALRIGALLESQGFARQALELYRQAVARHAADKRLRLRLAAALEAGGDRLEAGSAYRDAWDLDPADPAPRDRALSQFEAAGPAAAAPMRALLEQAVARDGADARLRYKLAGARLAAGDRAGAHLHMAEALRSDPGHPAFEARLLETLEGDSLILAYLPLIQSEYEKRGGSTRLVRLAARGFTLSGRIPEAGRAWFQLHTMAPQELAGDRDAVIALASSGDPAYLSIAGALAAPIAARDPEDRELGRILLRALLSDGRHDEASAQARRLLKSFPDEGGEALTAARTMLAMEQPMPAKGVLADLLKGRRIPEASLMMGGILHGEQDCPAAIDHLEAAADTFAVAWWLLGVCLEDLREPLRASLAYRTYFDRTGDKEGLVALARVDRAVADPVREKQTLDDMAAKGMLDEAGKLRLGHIRASLGDSAGAAAMFDDLFRQRAAVPAETSGAARTAWVEAGLFLASRQASQGRPEAAARVLALVLRADSARGDAWSLLGDCHAARRQWKPAAAAYAAAESAGGRSLELSRKQVEVAKRLDNRKDLAHAYASLAAADPADTGAQGFLAAWHQGERNYLDAAHHYRMLLKVRPGDAKAWENLGNCLALVPDMRAAGEALQKAIDLGAESDEVYLNRARAYREDGAKDMAASILDFLVNRNPRSYLALVWSAKFAREDGKAELADDLLRRAARATPPRTAWPDLAAARTGLEGL